MNDGTREKRGELPLALVVFASDFRDMVPTDEKSGFFTKDIDRGVSSRYNISNRVLIAEEIARTRDWWPFRHTIAGFSYSQ